MSLLSKFKLLIISHLKIWFTIFKSKLNRATFANLLMFSFILLTSIGTALIFLPAGLIVAGIACGVFGYLLGSE